MAKYRQKPITVDAEQMDAPGTIYDDNAGLHLDYDVGAWIVTDDAGVARLVRDVQFQQCYEVEPETRKNTGKREL